MHSNVSSCCLSLLPLLGPKVSFPDTLAYNTSLSSYFTQQNAHLHPACIVTPATPHDLSKTLSALTAQSQSQDNGHNHQVACPFALRSGGHAYNTAFNNIAAGVTLDLSNLNSISLSADQKTLAVGPGATWGEIYALLDPLNLSVPGGRAGQVGVAGLTLGGGISYFSPRAGWTCDSVVNFEIVLADGRVVNANETHNPELRVALCGGGGGNFGVVTRVDISTFPQGKIWGGFLYHTLDTIEGQLRAFEGFNRADGYDDFASLITSFAFSGDVGGAVVNSVVYTKVDGEGGGEETYPPAVYAPFFKLPRVSGTVRAAPLGEIATEQGGFSPDGRRQVSATITHTSTLSMLNATYSRWNTGRASIEHVPGIVWSFSLEPLPPSIYARHANANSMGLPEEGTESLVVSQLSASWDDESDDETVERAARVLIEGMTADAKELGAYEEYLYLNYAASWQDPIESYGEESLERLQRVQGEVDPWGVFRRGVKGFKIPA